MKRAEKFTNRALHKRPIFGIMSLLRVNRLPRRENL
jgi:hypothetical protein